MTIYVVTKGMYSDYSIITATHDKEKAEKIAEKYSDKWEYCDIEEYEDCVENVKPIWYVEFQNKTENVIDAHIEATTYTFRRANELGMSCFSYGNLYTYVFADNEKEAIKIAAEKRAMYLAEKNHL